MVLDHQSFDYGAPFDMAVKDLFNVTWSDRPVPDIFGIHHNNGSLLADTETTGIGEKDLAPDTPFFDPFHEFHHDIDSFLGVAEPFLLAVGP
jgi:hypothetical protein